MLSTISKIELVPAPNGKVHVEITAWDPDRHRRVKIIVDVTDEFNRISQFHVNDLLGASNGPQRATD